MPIFGTQCPKWVLRRQVTVMIFDIDHFESINYCFGHSAGDEILKLFAAVVVNSLRISRPLGAHHQTLPRMKHLTDAPSSQRSTNVLLCPLISCERSRKLRPECLT